MAAKIDIAYIVKRLKEFKRGVITFGDLVDGIFIDMNINHGPKDKQNLVRDHLEALEGELTDGYIKDSELVGLAKEIYYMEFLPRENKMKLTPNQKQLVKEYAKSLLSKRITEAAEDFEGPAFDELSVLFKKLVPSNGPAETVEGEMVRAMNRIIYRCYNDGDVIGKGYGKETVDPSAKWLVSRKELKGIGTMLRTAAKSVRIIKRGPSRYDVEYTTDAYMRNLLPAIEMVVDYVKSKKGAYTPFDGDSRH